MSLLQATYREKTGLQQDNYIYQLQYESKLLAHITNPNGSGRLLKVTKITSTKVELAASYCEIQHNFTYAVIIIINRVY